MARRAARVEAGGRSRGTEPRLREDHGEIRGGAATRVLGHGAPPGRPGRNVRAARRHDGGRGALGGRAACARCLLARESLVDSGVLAGGRWGRPSAGRARVDAAMGRGRRGGAEWVRMRRRCLPAPLGPSRPSTVARSTSKSTPRRAWVFPKCFVRPSVTTAGMAPTYARGVTGPRGIPGDVMHVTFAGRRPPPG